MPIVIGLQVALLLLCAAVSAAPTWEQIPDHLKQGEGVAQLEEYLVATGEARVENIRPDKAYEIARKKSFLRAMRIAHSFGSCKGKPEGLTPAERELFMRLFADSLPQAHIQGATVIRQWAGKDSGFTTIAVPASQLADMPCVVPDIQTAIRQYVTAPVHSLEGLVFCLQRTPRYSEKNREIRKRISGLFAESGSRLLANCFAADELGEQPPTGVNQLLIQNRLAVARNCCARAKEYASRGEWAEALEEAGRAVELLPAYSPAYLIAAEYLLKGSKEPLLASYAADKAMQDGTVLQEALKIKAQCLEAVGSPEVELYRLAASRYDGSHSDAALAEALDQFSEAAVPYLVLASFGHAVEGADREPDQLYKQAVAQFNTATSDDDVAKVVALLFQACNRQPASSKTYNLIGACFRHMGQHSIALPFLLQALQLNPEYDFALTNLGLCCRELGLAESARFFFEQEAVKTSGNAWVRETYEKFQQDAAKESEQPS